MTFNITELGEAFAIAPFSTNLISDTGPFFDASGNVVVITNPPGNGNYEYTIYDSDGSVLNSFIIDLETAPGSIFGIPSITDLVVREDGSFIAAFFGQTSAVRIFNADGTPQTDFIDVPGGGTQSLSLGPDGGFFITSGRNPGGTVTLIDPNLEDGSTVANIAGDVFSLEFDANGNQIGDEINLVDTDNLGSNALGQSHGEVTAVLSDGRHVVAFADDNNITDTFGTNGNFFTDTSVKVAISDGTNIQTIEVYRSEIEPDGNLFTSDRVFDALAANVFGTGHPQVVGLDNGGFAVLFTANDERGDLTPSRLLRYYDGDGNPLSDNVTLYETTGIASRDVDFISAALPDGRVAIVSREDNSIRLTVTELQDDGTVTNEQVIIADGELSTSGPAGLAIEGLTVSDTGELLVTYLSGSEVLTLRLAITTADNQDVLTGTDADETFSTGGGNDFVDAEGGDDLVDGGGGNDVLAGGSGNDDVFGRNGDDDLSGGDGNDRLIGGDGDDFLSGGNGVDRHFGEAGNDIIQGGLNSDVNDGGEGIDTVDYSRATNTQTINLVTNANIGGFAQNDTNISIENVLGSLSNGDNITGSAGDNVLDGQGAADVLRGFNGNDTLLGGDGNDFLSGDRGNDILDGGAGRDTVLFNGSEDGVIVDLVAGTATAQGGFSGDDTIVNVEDVRGSRGDDMITGDDNTNVLLGDLGNDIIIGGGGRDNIQGGGGNDILIGGTGTDGLRGNAGNDVFVFSQGDQVDNILDFDDAGNDQIDLTDFGFSNISEVQGLLQQTGNDVRLNFGDGDVLILRGTDLDDIDVAADFII